MKKLKVTVLGSGSFGTALATISARSGHNTFLYSKTQATVDDINKNRRNIKYFPENIEIPKNIYASTNLEECLSDSNMVIHAIPVQKSLEFMKENSKFVPNNIPYLISSKGILVNEKKFFSEVWEDVFPNERNIKHCVLSGPSFAIELMRNYPSVVTIACSDERIARFVQTTLHTSSFKSYFTTDVKGVEIGGALKNPLAIGSGLVEGLGFGMNTSSALVTRGIHEMSLFSDYFGGKRETLYGLSGIGDVMLTCLGSLSRNKAVGIQLAQGKTIDEIVQNSKEVAEGIPTLYVLDDIINQYNLNLPVFKTLSMVVKGQITAQDAYKYLMLRTLESENSLRI